MSVFWVTATQRFDIFNKDKNTCSSEFSPKSRYIGQKFLTALHHYNYKKNFLTSVDVDTLYRVIKNYSFSYLCVCVCVYIKKIYNTWRIIGFNGGCLVAAIYVAFKMLLFVQMDFYTYF